MLTLAALLAAPQPAFAGGDALGIAGSWSVVSTFAASTCAKPNDVGGVDAYSWLVSVDATGNYNVAVQGTTGYPRLTGKANASGLLLSGVEADGKVGAANAIMASDGGPFSDGRAAYRLGRTDLNLALKDGTLVGSRTVMLVEAPAVAPSAQAPAYYSPCRLDYTVVAKRN